MIFSDEIIEQLIDLVMEAQQKENTRLPVLKDQLRDTEKRLANLLEAIEPVSYTHLLLALALLRGEAGAEGLTGHSPPLRGGVDVYKRQGRGGVWKAKERGVFPP